MPLSGAKYRFGKKNGKTFRFAFKGGKVVEAIQFIKKAGKLVKK